MEKTLRHAGIGDLVGQLEDLEALKWDVVAPGSKIRSEAGRLIIADGDRTATERGVGISDISAVQTRQLRVSMMGRLGIPTKFGDRLYDDWTDPWDREPGQPDPLRDLYDVTVNRLMASQPGKGHLVRMWRNGDTEGRCMLSANYKPMDHLLTVFSALEAMNRTGIPMEVVSADLSDRRMFVKVACPEINIHAPRLLDGYVSPYGGARGSDNPTVFAGFILSNSETGHGRLTVTPCITVEVCKNGLVMTKDVLAKTHLGGELAEGEINWSSDVEAANRELVGLQVRDVVATSLSVEYLERKVAELEAKAGTPIEDDRAETVVADVGGKLKWSDGERGDILRAFIRGGQSTAGGLMQAVTAHSQRVADADRAYELEAQGVQAMELVR